MRSNVGRDDRRLGRRAAIRLRRQLLVRAGMVGREALTLLSGVDSAVKGIVVSGDTREAALADADDTGLRAFIAKPYTLEELDGALNSVICCGNDRALR